MSPNPVSASPILIVGTVLSRIVPTPVPSAIVALTGALKVTKYCSVISATESPKISTSMVAVVDPAGIITVPDVEP